MLKVVFLPQLTLYASSQRQSDAENSGGSDYQNHDFQMVDFRQIPHKNTHSNLTNGYGPKPKEIQSEFGLMPETFAPQLDKSMRILLHHSQHPLYWLPAEATILKLNQQLIFHLIVKIFFGFMRKSILEQLIHH